METGPGEGGAAAAASAASRAPSSEAGIFSAISAARSPSGPATGIGAGASAAAAGGSTGAGTGTGAGAGGSGRAMMGSVGAGGISARGTSGTGASSSLGIAFLFRAVVLRLGGSSTGAGAGSSVRLPRVLRRGGSPDISYPLSRTYSRIAPSVGWTGFAASSSCWAPAFERRAFSSFCLRTAS